MVIESARIDGRTFTPPLPTGVVLGPGEGRLEFRYAALTFLATERVRYRYKLEGFDRDWVEAGRRRDAYYTNIPAGQYAFRVVAASGDGLWNDVGATLALELRPRAWERRSVQALLAGGVLLLDEPAAHLDIGHQLRLFRVLDEVRACGVAVLAVVHDLPRAAAWAERMVLVAGGRVTADGPPAEVLLGPAAGTAFDVVVRGHAVPGQAAPVFSFEERG